MGACGDLGRGPVELEDLGVVCRGRFYTNSAMLDSLDGGGS